MKGVDAPQSSSPFTVNHSVLNFTVKFERIDEMHFLSDATGFGCPRSSPPSSPRTGRVLCS